MSKLKIAGLVLALIGIVLLVLGMVQLFLPHSNSAFLFIIISILLNVTGITLFSSGKNNKK